MCFPGVELRSVRFRYGSWELNADMQATQGSVTALLGASGAGKSTILSLIAGLERLESGDILIGGKSVTGLQPAFRPVSMLFQEHNLFAHMTAFRNVALGLKPGFRLSAEQCELALQALERVGLADKADSLPNQLSGGQRQRVAIARTLVMNRPVLLLDEPFVALGPALRQEMLELIDALRRDNNLTVILVTHDPSDAQFIAQETYFMADGCIIGSGETAEFLRKRSIPELASYLAFGSGEFR